MSGKALFCLFYYPLVLLPYTLLSTSYYFEFAVALLLMPDDSELAPVGGLGVGTRSQGLCLNQYLCFLEKKDCFSG